MYLVPWNIDIKTNASRFADRIEIAIFTFGKECGIIIAMNAYIQHIRIRFENMLCAIAMMYVPVDN